MSDVLDQWEAESRLAVAKNFPDHDKDARILALIELVRKKDEIIRGSLLTNEESIQLKNNPDRFAEWQYRSQHWLLHALELTEELK